MKIKIQYHLLLYIFKKKHPDKKIQKVNQTHYFYFILFPPYFFGNHESIFLL